MATRESVVAEACTWLRTPYEHLQRVKGAGVDCAQLLLAVFDSQGMLSPEAVQELQRVQYPAQWHLHRNEELYLAWLERYATRTERPRAGDVAIWKFGRTYSHAGILRDAQHVIHALRDSGEVTTTALDEHPLEGRPVQFFTVFKD